MPIAIKMAGKEIASYDTTTDKVAIKLSDDVSINDSAGNVVLGNSGLTSNVVFPTGHVIQVFGKNGLSGLDKTISSSTLTDISNSVSTDTLKVQFTTRQSNSKFLISLNVNILLNTGEGAGLGIHFNDGTTNADVYETHAYQLTASIPSGDIYQSLFNQFLYTSTTPANTDVTITGRIKSYLGSSIIVEVNENKGTSISVMEIAG